MSIRGPKRIYNHRALEAWFSRLTDNWEARFSLRCLEMGRRFYREGMVREIELDERDAIVHGKLEGKECHAIIEWRDSMLSTRSSLEDGENGRALAIAGLYEIEEMVADEISPVREDPPLEVEKPEPDPGEPAKRVDVGLPSRKLLLNFKVTARALTFRAYWRENGGHAAPCPAHLNGNNGSPLRPGEREQLIRLASMARKARFSLDEGRGFYGLKEVPGILLFLRHDLKDWRRHFEVSLDAGVLKLEAGIRPVEVTLRAKSGGGGLNLEWIFRTGDLLLGEREQQRLLRQNEGPVLLPGLGLLEIPSETLAAVRDWKRRFGYLGNTSGENLPSYMAFSLFAEKRFAVEGGEDLQTIRQQLTSRPRGLGELPGFLRNYQKQGVEWMAHLCEMGCHPLLADEMGLGKTLQVATLLALRPVREKVHLVVAPASVIPVWKKEIHRFFPGTGVHVLHNGNPLGEFPREGVWLASYAQVRRQGEAMARIPFGYAVLDEGQLIKNPGAKVSQSCFALRARHRLILTGTPLENRQLDLWSLFQFLMPGLLGARHDFERKAREEAVGMLRKLRNQIGPFVLRRTKSKVARELPGKIEMTLAAPMGELQRREYARICQAGLARLGDDLDATMRGGHSFGLFALLTRLRQVSCDPGLLPWQQVSWEESGKILLLTEKLADILAGGHKVVVFSQFVSLLERVDQALEALFPDVPRHRLTGATADRQQPVDHFQTGDGAAVILVSLKAGGTGITLHAADYLFLLDPWWNPAVENQAVDRVHRIGQKNTVFVYRIVSSGTIEERIQDLQERKKDLFDSLLGHMERGGGLREHFHSLRGLIELAGESEQSSA